MIDAIAFKFQTGTQWVHLPEKYDNWQGVHNRLRMWPVDGTRERVFTALMAQTDPDEDLTWAVSVDSTIVLVPARCKTRGVFLTCRAASHRNQREPEPAAAAAR